MNNSIKDFIFLFKLFFFSFAKLKIHIDIHKLKIYKNN